MSRRGRSRGGDRAENPVSLFPFLSVLICTMGTLILLLVVINRNARTQAAEQAGINTEEIIAEIDVEARTFEMFARDLQQTKERTHADIDTEKLRLATLDNEIENMVAEIERSQAAIREMENGQGQQNSETARLRESLAAKRDALQRAEAELQQLQDEAAEGKSSYAVIPYRGLGGTERRPIYIECRDDCVIIQPEGVVLREDDFLTASHPDNPLDAMLRAASLHYAEQQRTPGGTKPYPLIIVRPGGIDAYYAVRESIRSWGEHFGYELVESDWTLEFPPPDNALKQRLETQLAASRERMIPYKTMLMQRYLAANRTSGNAMPGVPRGGTSQGGTSYGGATFDGTSQGGMSQGGTMQNGLAHGGMTPGGFAQGGFAPSGIAQGGVAQNGLMQNSLVQGDSPYDGALSGHALSDSMLHGGMTSGEFGGAYANEFANGGSAYANTGGNGNAYTGTANSGSATGGGETRDGFENVDWGDVMATVNASMAGGGSTGGGLGGGATSAGSKPEVEYRVGPRGNMIRYEDGQPVVRGAPTGSFDNRPSTTNRQQNTAQSSDGTTSTGTTTAGTAMTGMSAANMAGDAGDMSDMSNAGMPSLGMTLGDVPQAASMPSMPRDWAMPNARQGDIEMTRPISVECLPDRVLIRMVGNSGVNREVDVPAGDNLATVGNTVASHVLDYIDTWGHAARGTCWRPELNVTVHPGAEPRFEELKSLMQNSGVKIRRR